MPSRVAQWLDEIVAAINAPSGQTALGGAVPAQRVYQDTLNLKDQESHAVFVSAAGWRQLGRCGGLTLQQQAVDVRVVQQANAAADNASLDVAVTTAEALRGLLTDFHGQHGGRVEQIIGPMNIDRAKLTFPGQAAIDLSLDCDILTGTADADAEPDEPSRLTVGRNAVWTAIENWPALDAVFQRTYKTSADFAELQLRDPAPWELPAIAVYWGDINPEWKWHRTQDWPLSMRLAVWLPGDRHTFAETLCETVFDAIYQAKPDNSTRSYIEQATGYPPRRVSSLTVSSIVLGRSQQVHALRADVAFALRSNKDPFGEESE